MSHRYRPAWWLPNPHLRTLWGRFTRRRLAVPTVHEELTAPDGDPLELHRFTPDGADVATTPRLFLLHGLEGGLHSHYVANYFDEARRRVWGVDLLLFRGCGITAPRARRLYHSGETTDADFVIRRVVAEHPGRPIGLAGVSLGGNVLLKWLGEQGDAVPADLLGAVAVSVPYDLARGCRFISRGFSHVYERYFLKTLKQKARDLDRRHPGVIDREGMERAETLWAFDDAVTAPVHGFANAEDYYRKSSSLGFLHRIRAPTLLLSAADDPFLPRAVLDEVREIAARTPALVPELVERGGHVGFRSGMIPGRGEWYAERRTFDFLSEQLAARSR